MKMKWMIFGLLGLLPLSMKAFAEEAGPIEDNSFLLEEGYNQEAGIVQFIQSYQLNPKTDEGLYSFTNEIPIGDERHQFSYVLPVVKPGGANAKSGLGDIQLNYRLQAFRKDDFVLTPRLSLLLPTGEYRERRGNGVLGFQTNLAASIVLNSEWVSHWNLGATLVPEAKSPDESRQDLRSFNYGASFIYLASPVLNFMLEMVGGVDEGLAGAETVTESFFTLSPGLRYAINAGQTQFVPGIAIPMTTGPSKGGVGVLFYLSIEPKLW